jgi:hypothetical protein
MALGQLTLAWNDLHVSLSMLFCGAMGGGNVSKYLAIWQNIASDRTQREVLKAVIQNDWTIMHPGNEALRDGIIWICNEATNLEDFRNNAIHSPLIAADKSSPVAPLTGLGHIRAKKLASQPNLLAQLRWCRDAASVLRNFAMEIDEAMTKQRVGPWPKKPKLPPRPATGGTQKPSQKQKATRRSPA